MATSAALGQTTAAVSAEVLTLALMFHILWSMHRHRRWKRRSASL